MSDVRIIAVSLEGGEHLQHITHVWTVGGALSKQRVVEELWSGRCRYYVLLPTGRVDVAPVPPRGPNFVTAFFGHRVRGNLESPRDAAVRDSLLTLPRLPSPTRPRRSRALASATEGLEKGFRADDHVKLSARWPAVDSGGTKGIFSTQRGSISTTRA